MNEINLYLITINNFFSEGVLSLATMELIATCPVLTPIVAMVMSKRALVRVVIRKVKDFNVDLVFTSFSKWILIETFNNLKWLKFSSYFFFLSNNAFALFSNTALIFDWHTCTHAFINITIIIFEVILKSIFIFLKFKFICLILVLLYVILL